MVVVLIDAKANTEGVRTIVLHDDLLRVAWVDHKLHIGAVCSRLHDEMRQVDVV